MAAQLGKFTLKKNHLKGVNYMLCKISPDQVF